MVKQLPHIVLTLFIGVIATLGVFARASQTAELPRTIEVNGKATIYAVPDVVTFSVRYSDSNKNLSHSMNLAESILNTLQEFGVSKADIRTSDLSIYDQQEGPFQTNGNFVVTLRDFSQLNPLLKALTGRQGVDIYTVSFTVNDEQPFYQQARLEALANAHDMGLSLAEAMAYQLGDVIRIEGDYQTITNPQNGYNTMPEHPSEVVLTINDSPILPGQVSLTAGMKVTFELKPKS